MLLWVCLIFMITLLFSISFSFYKEPFLAGKDDTPLVLSDMKLDEFQSILDAGIFWKDVDLVRLQELLKALDNQIMKDMMTNNKAYLDGLSENVRKERGKELLDLFQVKFYDDYHALLDVYEAMDRVSGTTYPAKNTTIGERHAYYSNFDTSQKKEAQEELQRLKDLLLKETLRGAVKYSLFINANNSYKTLSEFYNSGFKEENGKKVPKTQNLDIIFKLDRTNFILEYKRIILNLFQKGLLKQTADTSTNALALAQKNAMEIQPAASLSFFANIMEKLKFLEKKELVPVFTNKPVDTLAVDRYLEPSCKQGESLFCSGEIRCTDIYGNDIPNMMKTEENTSYTMGKTHSNCGSYTNRIEYKDWIGSLSKNLVNTATEIISYDISNCTITNPWKLNASCYLTVEKAQDAFLKNNTAKNELLLGSIVLVETTFMEDFFYREAESIFKLNHPTENMQIQRLKYKGDMQMNDANQDIDTLKKVPKIWVNQTTYYKAKITQINKDGYDLIIPDDYGLKVNGIKKEYLFMPNVSYLKDLNETLTDATVNSMPRPMCSGSFSKCSKTPKIEYDPSDTMKKNLIQLYDKASPYLLTSAEVSDNCPSTASLGFSLF